MKGQINYIQPIDIGNRMLFCSEPLKKEMRIMFDFKPCQNTGKVVLNFWITADPILRMHTLHLKNQSWSKIKNKELI